MFLYSSAFSIPRIAFCRYLNPWFKREYNVAKWVEDVNKNTEGPYFRYFCKLILCHLYELFQHIPDMMGLPILYLPIQVISVRRQGLLCICCLLVSFLGFVVQLLSFSECFDETVEKDVHSACVSHHHF